jgi:hypothetical protein
MHLGERVITELHSNLPTWCSDERSLPPQVAHRLSH